MIVTYLNKQQALDADLKAIQKINFTENLQSVSEYFKTFWRFTKFSFHGKWNNERLLLINMVYTSSPTSCQTN